MHYNAFDEYHVNHNLNAMEKLFAGYVNTRLDSYLAMLEEWKYCGCRGMFVSEYFGLDDELDKMGVFGCVLDNDSRFFINLSAE